MTHTVLAMAYPGPTLPHPGPPCPALAHAFLPAFAHPFPPWPTLSCADPPTYPVHRVLRWPTPVMHHPVLQHAALPYSALPCVMTHRLNPSS